MAKTAGEISEIRGIRESYGFEWKTPLLHSIIQGTGNACQSPPCMFCNEEWTFTVRKHWGYVEFHLNRSEGTLSHDNNVACKLFKIARDGAELFIRESRHKFFGGERKLKVFTEFYAPYINLGNLAMKITCLLECFVCKSEAPVVLPKCSGTLGRDFMDLLMSGEDSDVTINVKDRVFRVHKAIIRARSPVVFSMLKHDMVEKISGNIYIPDCDPEAFQKFLEHIYSGEMKDLSKDVVCSLYYIADKYQVSEVKEECVNFMSINLYLGTFFDIAELSVRHGEMELLERASQFFIDNAKEIIQTDRWVTFLDENPAAANDLLKKLLIPEAYPARKRKLDSTAGKDEILKKKKTEIK